MFSLYIFCYNIQQLMQQKSLTISQTLCVQISSQFRNQSTDILPSVDTIPRKQYEQLQHQVGSLKQKAHQSFMQVIHMQQLHDQQIQQIRAEYQHREKQLRLKLQQIDLKCQQLSYQNNIFDKNYNHHCFDIEVGTLQINDIEAIICIDQTKLDESSILSFKELIDSHVYHDRINSIKLELVTEIRLIPTHQTDQLTKTELMIEKIFDYISYLKQQFGVLVQKIDQNQRICEQLESKAKAAKHFNQSLQKQSKFMTEHIKKISNDKLKIEKKLIDSQNVNRNIDYMLKKIEAELAKRQITIDQLIQTSNRTNNFYQEGNQNNSFDIRNIIVDLNFTKSPIHSQINFKRHEKFTHVKKI